MNRLPSPFASDLPTILTPQNSSSNSSPGFLMLTRPSNASLDHSGRIKSGGRGRGNHWSNRSPQDYRGGHYSNNSSQDYRGGHYSNNSPTGFTPNRHQGNYFNNRSPYRGNHNKHFNRFQTPSPNNSFTSCRNTPPSSDQSSMQSTPNSSKKLFKQSFQGHKNTPLKSIPIEKFISIIMMKDPWENLQVKSLPEKDCSVEDSLDEDEPSPTESQSITDSPVSDGVSGSSDADSD